MKVRDLQPKQGNVDITLSIVDKREPREFNKFGKTGRVCSCVGEDDTGKVFVTLWNEQVDKVEKGKVVKFENAYVNEYKGDMQLTTGKFGTIEVIETEGTQNKSQNKSQVDEEFID